MFVLVACEESQRVCAEFRRLGHESYSCDIVPCSGGHPEWHIQQDVVLLLDGNCIFHTMDGKKHYIVGSWDMIIAFPPCTYLSKVAQGCHSLKRSNLEYINKRTTNRLRAVSFFMLIVSAYCKRIAIENPVGVMNTFYRKPDQIISPYMFADSVDDLDNYLQKTTCLWLKGLSPLKTNSLPKPDNKSMYGVSPSGKAYTWVETVDRSGGAAKVRSKTFPGIAKAMAEQWG